MRYVITIIVLIVASSIISLQPIPAQTSQNLEWNLEIGNRLNYTYAAFDTEGLILQTRYILEITSLPEIPDPLTNESTLVLPSYLQLYENGTEIEGVPVDLLWWMLPIGNWSLLSDYYEDLLSANITIVQDDDAFGFITFYPAGGYLMRIEIHCLKTDGALLISNRQMYSEGEVVFTAIVERGWTDITTTTTTLTTTSTTTNTDTSSNTTEETPSTETNSTTAGQLLITETLVLVFVSGGVVVLIVVVVFLKKK